MSEPAKFLSLVQAVALLVSYQHEPQDVQRRARDDIREAFRVFWRARPHEAEFSRTMNGLVLMPEMLYIMVEGCPRLPDE